MTYTDEQLEKAARWLCEKWYPSLKQGHIPMTICRAAVRQHVNEQRKADIEEALRKAVEE